jgi:RimJ/RimL family protein N-acetyltransferase
LDHVLFNSPAYAEEVAKLARVQLPLKHTSFCRVRDGELLGGIIYYDKRGKESVSAHIGAYSPHWINRTMLFVGFDFPFNQLQVKRIFGFVPETNEQAVQFNQKLGFQIVNRIEYYFKHGVACLVMRLDREDCRYLAVKARFMREN